jgi:FkbM family methyltransferase
MRGGIFESKAGLALGHGAASAVRAARFIYRFGALAGAHMFLQTLGRGTAVLQVPGTSTRLLVRKGTSDVPTFERIFAVRDYAFDLTGLAPRVIIDAGANVGYSTAYFALRFPEARIFALEPEPENFHLLVQNTRAFPNVVPLRKALWRRACRLRTVDRGAEPWAFQVDEREGGAPGNIEGTTVPALLASTREGRADLLKIDIEGSEREVFADGSADWLGRCSAIIIELHDRFRTGCAQSFYRALAPFDYAQEIRGENICVRLLGEAAP